MQTIDFENSSHNTSPCCEVANEKLSCQHVSIRNVHRSHLMITFQWRLMIGEQHQRWLIELNYWSHCGFCELMWAWLPWNLSFRYILFHKKRLQTMLWHHNTRVSSHQRWKQMQFHVCFHLWCAVADPGFLKRGGLAMVKWLWGF